MIKSELNEHEQTRLTLAAFFVAFSKALSLSDKRIAQRFDEEIEKIYREMEDYKSEPIGTMEALTWAHNLLRATEATDQE